VHVLTRSRGRHGAARYNELARRHTHIESTAINTVAFNFTDVMYNRLASSKPIAMAIVTTRTPKPLVHFPTSMCDAAV
jgi:hypothetical protein